MSFWFAVSRTHSYLLCTVFVYDVLKLRQCTEKLIEVRTVVKRLRANLFRFHFSKSGIHKPFLDVLTRWMSTYEMMKCVVDQKEFILDLIKIDPTFVISTDQWSFMDQFEEAFSPLQEATTKLQYEQLVIGDCLILLNKQDEKKNHTQHKHKKRRRAK